MSWGLIFYQGPSCLIPILYTVNRPMWIYLRLSDSGGDLFVGRSVHLYSPSSCLSAAPIPPSQRPQFTRKFSLFSWQNSLAVINQVAIIRQLLVTASLGTATRISVRDTLGRNRIIDRIGALDYTTDGRLLMWETIRRWLSGLFGQLAPSLHALCLDLIGIAAGVIAYAAVRAGAVLTRDISDYWKDPAASEFFKSLEWFITVAGVFAAALFVICSTIKFMNDLFVVFFGVNFIEIIKKRLGLDGSNDQAKNASKKQTKKKAKIKRKKKYKKSTRK